MQKKAFDSIQNLFNEKLYKIGIEKDYFHFLMSTKILKIALAKD